jgi:adenylate cyclase
MAVAGTPPLCFDGLTLDPAARTLVNAGGASISLRRSEFELLLTFVNNPGRALSRDYLLETVAGRHSEAFDRSIDVLVGRLRRKIEREPSRPRLIVTVPSVGYRFAVKPSPVAFPEEQEEAGSTPSPSAPRLSIVVLPFTNLSDDPEQQYFADGITDDLTIDLSRIEHMFVISRNTAFTYRNKRVDTKQIGRELGVRYVLEGSVRQIGNQVRVNTQLIDAESDAHLWADRFDTNRTNLAETQDAITSRLARTLNLEMVEATASRIEREGMLDPDARDLVMCGWACWYRPRSAANQQEAQWAFERALKIDPRSVDAKIGLASVLAANLSDARSRSAQEDEMRAEQLLLEAIEHDVNRSTSHQAMGHLRRSQNRLTESQIELETAIALDRNNARAFFQLGMTLMYLGRPEAAIPQLENAMRLNPRDPNVAQYYWGLGACHLLLDRKEEAIDLLRKACTANPWHYYPPLHLAGALGLKGDLDEARAALGVSIRLQPEINSLAKWRSSRPYLNNPQYQALLEKTFNVGLRRAGFPVE